MNPKTHKYATSLIGATLLGFSLQSFSVCEKDAVAPDLPNPKVASEAEMEAANVAVNQYIKDTEAYLECVKGGRRYGKAYARLTEVAEDYNRRVRIYKDRIAQNQDSSSVATSTLALSQ